MPDEHDQPAGDDHDVFYDAPAPEAATQPEAASTRGSGAESTADVLVSALLEAGPEAAEHLLKAAQELLLAAKAVVDAGERVIEQTRSAGGDDDAGPTRAPGDSGDERRVRRIDLA